MSKAVKKKINEEQIPIEKLISKEEMNALIEVLKSRQAFFQGMVNDRSLARERGEAALEERIGALASKELKAKLKMLTEKLMAEADKVYLAKYKEELSHQPGVVEFLNRFTNEKFEDLSVNFEL
jgi:hypothetical protein